MLRRSTLTVYPVRIASGEGLCAKTLERRPESWRRYSYWSGGCGLEDRAENYGEVTFELHSQGGQTTRSVLQSGDPSEKSQQSSNQGWDAVLSNIKRLAESL